MSKRTLSQVLDGTLPSSSTPEEEDSDLTMEDDESFDKLQQDQLNQSSAAHNDGMCIECGDQPASLFCEQCCDDYCEVCFAYLHKKGTRRKHTTKSVVITTTTTTTDTTTNNNNNNSSPIEQDASKRIKTQQAGESMHDEEGNTTTTTTTTTTASSIYYTRESAKKQAIASSEEEEEAEDNDSQASSTSNGKDHKNKNSNANGNAAALSATPTPISSMIASVAPSNIAERAKYIPMRLSLTERKALRLLEAAIKVSEYTDRVDIISFKSKTSRIHAQVKDVCAILSGLVVASDYPTGQALIRDKNFEDNELFFQTIFEVGRRHKIMNPEKMRSEYGKLLYMLMDTQLSEVKDLLGFNCVKDIKMVHSHLVKKNAVEMLSDEYIVIATSEILSDDKSRDQVQREIKMKERAIEHLSRKYANDDISSDNLKTCLYSIGDNNAFLRGSRDCCDQMLHYLTSMFHPKEIEDPYSLAIRAGQAGHRLTHSHERQYHYVFQSLTLWREILNDMFRLWYFCEQDLLDAERSPYRLRDTGQGLNRLQSCPRISKAMHNILYRVQRVVGENWVGSSVIHLGDHNVPNALMFIDKYTQVERILSPIVTALGHIDKLTKDRNIANYIDCTFGGSEELKKEILCDFFQSGFDGSGADNFMDAGSCIDGRLTSAWNWCSQIEKKRFFPVFLLTGFIGFDGRF